MSRGLFGSLQRLTGSQRGARMREFASRCGRPFLESLESRALPSVLLGTSRTIAVDVAPPESPYHVEAPTGGPTVRSSVLTVNPSLLPYLPSDPHQGDNQPGQDGGQDDSSGDNTQGQDNTGQQNGQQDQGASDGNQQGQDNSGSSNQDGNSGDPQQGSDNGQNNANNGTTTTSSDGNGSGTDSSTGSQNGTTTGTDTSADGSNGSSDNGDSAPLDGNSSGTTSAHGHGGCTNGADTPPTDASAADSSQSQVPTNGSDSGTTPTDGTAAVAGSRTTTDPNSTLNAGTASNTTSAANGSDSSMEKKHGPSGIGLSDTEPRGPLTNPEVKPRSAEGTILLAAEEARTQVLPGNQGPELIAHVVSGLPTPSPNGSLEERGAAAQLLPKAATEETTPCPAADLLLPVSQDLSEYGVSGQDFPVLAPRQHGLLVDTLALDFASLRSDVESFFAQIDDLGGYATERRISMMLSSGAVVVAAALACEVARRQARRSASETPFGAPWGDRPSRLGLPHFGSFSAFP